MSRSNPHHRNPGLASAAVPRRARPRSCWRLAVTLAAPWMVGLTQPAGACDLKAEFVAPTAHTLAGTQPVQWEMRFSNVAASGHCPSNQVSLVRQTQSGSSPALGGVGPAPLNSLAPGQSVMLRLVEQVPPASGSFVYRVTYGSKFLDANERNHHPSKSVSFQATATIGG